MSISDAPAQSAEQPHAPESGSRLLFLFGAVIVAVALGIAAAHAPERIRLLGLFSLGFGILVGLIMTQVASFMRCRLGVFEFVVIGVVTCVGLVGSTWQSFSLLPQPKPSSDINPIAAALINQMQKDGGPLPDTLEMSAPTPLEHPADRFRQYLANRVHALGNWSNPWPEIFWGAEVLAGTFGAVWIAWRLRQREAAS